MVRKDGCCVKFVTVRAPIAKTGIIPQELE